MSKQTKEHQTNWFSGMLKIQANWTYLKQIGPSLIELPCLRHYCFQWVYSRPWPKQISKCQFGTVLQTFWDQNDGLFWEDDVFGSDDI